MATPTGIAAAARQAATGSPYGLHPPRLAAHLWTYTTSWDISD